MGISAEVLDDARGVLEAFRDRPTEIQRASIPRMLARENIVIGSETGSGKTLAYTLPLFDMLRAEDKLEGRCVPYRPRALVVLPSRELALQAYSVGKGLAGSLQLRTAVLVGGQKAQRQRRKLKAGVEIVYANAGRLLQFINSGDLFLSKVQHVIFDEADCMFLDGFNEEMGPLMDILSKQRAPPQYVFVGASLPPRLARVLDMTIPGLRRVTLRSLHRKPRSLAESFVDVGVHDKHDALLAALRAEGVVPTSAPRGRGDEVGDEFDDDDEDNLDDEFDAAAGAAARLGAAPGQPQQPQEKQENLETQEGGREAALRHDNQWIVFCNTIQSCRSTEFFLAENGYADVVTSVHGKVPPHERRDNFARFAAGAAQILVCTDIAGRGIDIDTVSGVVNFDFPQSGTDYLHRVGRTARSGRAGKAVHLVTKHEQKLAKRLAQGDFDMDDTPEAAAAAAREHRRSQRKKKKNGRGDDGDGKALPKKLRKRIGI